MKDPDSALLDVRPEPAFNAGHLPGAANVPLEELPARIHELPPREEPIAVVDADPARAERAAAFLRERGHPVEVRQIEGAGALVETGAARAHLWRPNPFLVEALGHAAGGEGWRALDVACGSGRDAVHLALAGYEVEAVDVLPDALERAADLARRSGVAIETVRHDLERDPTLPRERYDLVAVFHFLWRELFPSIRAALRPGGFVVYETFHERTRETGGPPRSAAHLLRSGELEAAFGAREGFEVVIARDAVRQRDGRYVSSLLARKRA